MVLAERLKQELVNRRIVMKGKNYRERRGNIEGDKKQVEGGGGGSEDRGKFWDNKERKGMSEKKCPLSPILCNIIS